MINRKITFSLFLTFVALISLTVNSKELILNVDSLWDNFILEFCLHCPEDSDNCQNNLKNVKIQETNYFSRETIEQNKFGIQSIMTVINSVTNDYIFPEKKLTSVPMKYLALFPEFPDKKLLLQGVVVYMHPTIFGKKEIPSEYGNQIKALAALYCSQGFALVIPNYIGYELNSN